MIEKKTEDRPQSPDELIEETQKILSGTGVSTANIDDLVAKIPDQEDDDDLATPGFDETAAKVDAKPPPKAPVADDLAGATAPIQAVIPPGQAPPGPTTVPLTSVSGPAKGEEAIVDGGTMKIEELQEARLSEGTEEFDQTAVVGSVKEKEEIVKSQSTLRIDELASLERGELEVEVPTGRYKWPAIAASILFLTFLVLSAKDLRIGFGDILGGGTGELGENQLLSMGLTGENPNQDYNGKATELVAKFEKNHEYYRGVQALTRDIRKSTQPALTRDYLAKRSQLVEKAQNLFKAESSKVEALDLPGNTLSNDEKVKIRREVRDIIRAIQLDKIYKLMNEEVGRIDHQIRDLQDDGLWGTTSASAPAPGKRSGS